MISWTVVVPYLRKFGPYILIVAAVGGVWLHGRHSGSEKWQQKHDEVVAERDSALAAAEHNANEVETLKEAKARQDAALAKWKEDQEAHESEVEARHRATLARQAQEQQRALAEAQREAAELRSRIADLPVGEACHEAMLEVVR